MLHQALVRFAWTRWFQAAIAPYNPHKRHLAAHVEFWRQREDDLPADRTVRKKPVGLQSGYQYTVYLGDSYILPVTAALDCR